MMWETAKLGDYIDIQSGYAFKSNDFTDRGIPVIKIKNITPPSVSLDDLSFVPNEVAELTQKFLLNYNDVLIALTGSHINQMASVVGRVARVKYNQPSMLNQRVARITVKDSTECDIDYVYYYLSQDEIKIKLASNAGGAANQANISPSDVKNLIIPFPKYKRQKAISSILSAYDDLIENNQKQIKLLKEAARRLYKEWFVDLRFPGHETTPIVDGVPKGWETKKLKDIIIKAPRTKQIKTSDYLTNGNIPIVDQSRGFICGYTNDIEAKIVCNKPIIVFGDHTRVLKYITFDFAKGADGTQLILSNNKNVPQSYLYCALVNIDLSNYHYARHFKYLKTEDIIIPNKRIADKFDSIVSPIFTQIQTLRDKSNNAKQARDRLLPRLMNGEIEV